MTPSALTRWIVASIDLRVGALRSDDDPLDRLLPMMRSISDRGPQRPAGVIVVEGNASDHRGVELLAVAELVAQLHTRGGGAEDKAALLGTARAGELPGERTSTDAGQEEDRPETEHLARARDAR